jgi:hypothetical protein
MIDVLALISAVLLSLNLLLGYILLALWRSNRLLQKRIVFLHDQLKDSAYYS